jgi:hypothetical protein
MGRVTYEDYTVVEPSIHDSVVEAAVLSEIVYFLRHGEIS